MIELPPVTDVADSRNFGIGANTFTVAFRVLTPLVAVTVTVASTSTGTVGRVNATEVAPAGIVTVAPLTAGLFEVITMF